MKGHRVRVTILTAVALFLALATTWSPPRAITSNLTIRANSGVFESGVCIASPGCNREPYCSGGCAPWRPCDKACRLDDESCSTCGDYGVCDGGGGPPPPPPPDCENPFINADPPEQCDYDNNGLAGITLAVSNSTSDIVNCCFTWNFGDGSFNQTHLEGTHGFPAPAGQTQVYTVYWEGWANCASGDRFISASRAVTVHGFGVCGGGGVEPPLSPF